jgi:(E)-4-hydroxy-3-methylbut-2-enyl-diphosphate synthase
VPEAQIVETLIEEAMRIAEEMGADTEADPGTAASGSPIVTVS